MGIDRPAALREANQWRASPDLKDEPTWRSQIDWLIARATAEQVQAQRPKGLAPAEAEVRWCAELLRGEGVQAAAPRYERMEALVRLDAAAGGALLTRGEALEWAEILSGAGHPNGVAAFDRVVNMAGPALEAEPMMRFAALLWRQGQWLRAADVCDRVLPQLPAGEESHAGVIQLRAGALLKAYWQEGPAMDALRKRVLDALAPVYESNLPEAVRREALAQWASLSAEASPQAIQKVLGEHPDLVRGSALLLYCRALQNRALLPPPGESATRPAADSKKAAQAILADLRASQSAAREANDAPMLARAVVLEAQVIWRPPLQDPQAALQVLMAGRAAIEAVAPLAREAAWLRIQLLMDLGSVDAAMKELAALPQEGPSDQAAVPLRLAGVLAGRYPSADEAARGRLREQVLDLCNRAIQMTQTLPDPNAYLGAARRSARTMLAVGAAADAEPILGSLLRNPSIRGDPQTRQECSVLLARSLQEQGKTVEAARQFDDLAGEFPNSSAVHLYRGRFQLDTRQAEAAAESFRAARRLAKEGSAPWCEATLDLAAALQAQGQAPAAADILRVARALYPDFGNVKLRARLDRVQEQLNRNVPTTGSSS
jgi:hypothetical protein